LAGARGERKGMKIRIVRDVGRKRRGSGRAAELMFLCLLVSHVKISKLGLVHWQLSAN
jgi:hypothetical protein